jgi:hypothetical protein
VTCEAAQAGIGPTGLVALEQIPAGRARCYISPTGLTLVRMPIGRSVDAERV